MKIRLSLIKIIMIIIFLSICIYLIASICSETIKPDINNTITPLENKVSSIKEALDVAENKAKSIDKNVKLTNMYIYYDGYQQILERTGHIGFDFSLRNNNFYNMLTGQGYEIEIEIDLGKNAITKFITAGPANELGKDKTIKTIPTEIDLNVVFNLIKEKYGNDVLSIGPYIEYNNDHWFYHIFDKNNRSLNGEIDTVTGKIVNASDDKK